MFTNILELITTDVFYQLWLVAHANHPDRYEFTFHDWDEYLVSQFPNASDVPAYIKVEEGSVHHLNKSGNFHLGRNAPSLIVSEMTIIWGEEDEASKRYKIIPHNINAPAKIVITKMKKWHHDGILHRRRGDAIIIKNASFTWAKKGLYCRDAGPYHVSLKQISAKAHLGDVYGFNYGNFSTSWNTSSGRMLSGFKVNSVLVNNDIEVDLLRCDSIFKDATDEVIFLTEIAE